MGNFLLHHLLSVRQLPPGPSPYYIKPVGLGTPLLLGFITTTCPLDPYFMLKKHVWSIKTPNCNLQDLKDRVLMSWWQIQYHRTTLEAFWRPWLYRSELHGGGLHNIRLYGVMADRCKINAIDWIRCHNKLLSIKFPSEKNWCSLHAEYISL